MVRLCPCVGVRDKLDSKDNIVTVTGPEEVGPFTGFGIMSDSRCVRVEAGASQHAIRDCKIASDELTQGIQVSPGEAVQWI